MTFPWSEGAHGPFQDPGGEAVGADIRAYRNIYFVDNKRGRDGNPGLSINTAFSSVQKALDTVQDEDTIIVFKGTGSYDEKLVTGQNIRHAAMKEGRGRSVTLIGATPTTLPYASPQLYNVSSSEQTIYIRSPNWRISGFRLIGDSGSPFCMKMEFAQAGNTADTNWAPGTQVDNCVFYGAVGSTGGMDIWSCPNIRILNNQFELFSAAIPCMDNTGGVVAPPGRSLVRGNMFMDNVQNIDMAFNNSLIVGNYIGMNKENTMTKGLNIEPAGDNANSVHQNYFSGDYALSGGLYRAGDNDNWFGNYSDDTGDSLVNAAGQTLGVPA